MTDPQSDLLPRLAPPGGGWERLLVRRERQLPVRTAWLALASGLATTLVLGLLLPSPHRELPLPATAARLLDAPATGQPLRLLRPGLETLPLPSDDEGVQIYWIRPAGSEAR